MVLLRAVILFLCITVLFFSGVSLGAEEKYNDAFDGVVAVQRQMSDYYKKLPEVMVVKMTREEMKFVMATIFSFRLSLNKSNHLHRIAYNMYSCRDDEAGCRKLLLERCVKLNERVKKEITEYIDIITGYRKFSDSRIISENVDQVINLENNLIIQIDKLCK